MYSLAIIVIRPFHLDSSPVLKASAKVAAAAEEIQATKFRYVLAGVKSLVQRRRELLQGNDGLVGSLFVSDEEECSYAISVIRGRDGFILFEKRTEHRSSIARSLTVKKM